jgi:hypothetical protein
LSRANAAIIECLRFLVGQHDHQFVFIQQCEIPDGNLQTRLAAGSLDFLQAFVKSWKLAPLSILGIRSKSS